MVKEAEEEEEYKVENKRGKTVSEQCQEEQQHFVLANVRGDLSERRIG